MVTHHRTRNAGLERRLDLLLEELLKVDMLPKERVPLNLVCAIHAQSASRVAREETGEYAACVGADLRAKDERILQDFLVHLIGDLCVR